MNGIIQEVIKSTSKQNFLFLQLIAKHQNQAVF